MGTVIKCYVGILRETIRSLFTEGWLDPHIIEAAFARGAALDQGETAIRLKIDEKSRLTNGTIPKHRKTDIFYLNKRLDNLLGFQDQEKFISKIGLIIADRLQGHPSVLGVMFDLGFNSDGFAYLNDYYRSIPREGCAIFLDAIQALRPTENTFQKECLFTIVHELGHVFNLWHEESAPNFMASSPGADQEPYDRVVAHHFFSDHRHFLQRYPELQVAPGGHPFGKRGGYGPEDRDPHNLPNSRKGLILELQMHQQEFWFFEPIELDISIRVRRDIKKTYQLPDRIDPGYDDFHIFIDQPDGTRTKYQPTKRFCCNNSTIRVSSKNPFHRDLSLFGQSGGYTFSQCGEHSINAIMLLPDGNAIFSNCLKFHVRKPLNNSTVFSQMRSILTDNTISKVFYHRNGSLRKREYTNLIDLWEKNKKTPLGANIDYAIGRVAEQNLCVINKEAKKRYTQLMDYHMKRGLDSGLLSKGRLLNAKKCIDLLPR